MPESPIDHTAPEWPYAQIAAVLAAEIKAGTWATGRPFATERELTARFGVDRKTVRAALDSLRADKLIFTVPRRGTFVAEHPGNTESL